MLLDKERVYKSNAKGEPCSFDFGVESRSMLEILSGKFEPSGLLPFQMPIDMKTVELQKEDVSRDMIPYVDSKGNKYDFAFGMNWSGVINDKRVKKYK